MNLGCSIVNSRIAQLGMHELKRHFLCHAHGTECLHHMIHRFICHFTSVPFYHRDLLAYIVATIKLPSPLVCHQPRGMNLGRCFRRPELDRLALRERDTECLALRRILKEHVERALRHAYRPRRNLTATSPESGLHRREPITFLAEQLPPLDATILNSHLIREITRNHRDFSQYIIAWRAPVDEERRNAAACTLPGIGNRHDDREIGFGGLADPYFATVENPVITVPHRARGYRGRIRT